ncbi:hypothetical protein MMC06_001130 [Schaereria dolodes]|nr:hypothetical protein [Schaereria dolodes]
MSLTVKHINGDSTFLLTFSPLDNDLPFPGPPPSVGTFSILVDPWLSGPSTVWHPRFAVTKHTVPACITHLSELPPPNIILISQDKPDHCHEATLRQLDPSLRDGIILAVPAAAKKIRGWKYFKSSRIFSLPTFSDKSLDSIVRFSIPSPVPGAEPGEATIAFIPAKRDITGLHNAMGITYRPPLATTPFCITPELTEHPTALSAFKFPFQGTHVSDHEFPPTPPDSPTLTSSTAPTTPSTINNHFSLKSSHSTNSSITSSNHISMSGRPKTLSVLYSPHGVTYSHIIPYASSHLVLAAALPLTALLHSFDRIQNSWWLGGNISAGLTGGIEIAQNLLAKCWISAHDEAKEDSGLAVKTIVAKRTPVEEVRELVERGRSGGKVGIDVRSLDSGEEMVLQA